MNGICQTLKNKESFKNEGSFFPCLECIILSRCLALTFNSEF